MLSNEPEECPISPEVEGMDTEGIMYVLIWCCVRSVLKSKEWTLQQHRRSYHQNVSDQS